MGPSILSYWVFSSVLALMEVHMNRKQDTKHFGMRWDHWLYKIGLMLSVMAMGRVGRGTRFWTLILVGFEFWVFLTRPALFVFTYLLLGNYFHIKVQ